MTEQDYYIESDSSPINSEIIKRGDEMLIDIQISTAKRYPRNEVDIRRKLVAFILNPENKKFAEVCQYAVPRNNAEPVVGPSVHLARLCLQHYGNMRVSSKITSISETHISSTAYAWDLETNTAISVEVMRGITKNEYGPDGKKTGKRIRYGEDLIGVTGNAANAISMRNAILAVIPKSLINEVYAAAKKAVIGDISTDELFNVRREELINYCKGHFNVTQEEILSAIKRPTIAAITKDDLLVLRGFITAIIEGDSSVDGVFRPTEETVKKKSRFGSRFKEEANGNDNES